MTIRRKKNVGFFWPGTFHSCDSLTVKLYYFQMRPPDFGHIIETKGQHWDWHNLRQDLGFASSMLGKSSPFNGGKKMVMFIPWDRIRKPSPSQQIQGIGDKLCQLFPNPKKFPGQLPLPETNSKSTWKIGHPKRKHTRLPTIHFSGAKIHSPSHRRRWLLHYDLGRCQNWYRGEARKLETSGMMTSWWLNLPTHLKNMQPSNWIISPRFGVIMKYIWNHHLDEFL